MSTLTARPMQPSAEYVAAYHYPLGSAIPFEQLVLDEAAYTNLEEPGTCPLCGSRGTQSWPATLAPCGRACISGAWTRGSTAAGTVGTVMRRSR